LNENKNLHELNLGVFIENFDAELAVVTPPTRLYKLQKNISKAFSC
jgi:hypothetical protein